MVLSRKTNSTGGFACSPCEKQVTQSTRSSNLSERDMLVCFTLGLLQKHHTMYVNKADHLQPPTSCETPARTQRGARSSPPKAARAVTGGIPVLTPASCLLLWEEEMEASTQRVPRAPLGTQPKGCEEQLCLPRRPHLAWLSARPKPEVKRLLPPQAGPD